MGVIIARICQWLLAAGGVLIALSIVASIFLPEESLIYAFSYKFAPLSTFLLIAAGFIELALRNSKLQKELDIERRKNT
jgi:hypothetical protein